MKLLATLVLFAAVASANPLLPEKVHPTDLTLENYFGVFGQYLQKEDGNFTSEFGQVLIVKDQLGFDLAFYEKSGDAYRRIGEIVRFDDTRSPHASALPDLGVPCIRAIKNDGSGKIHAFVLKGTVSTKVTKK